MENNYRTIFEEKIYRFEDVTASSREEAEEKAW